MPVIPLIRHWLSASPAWRWLLVVFYTTALPWLILPWNLLVSASRHGAITMSWVVVVSAASIVAYRLAIRHAGKMGWLNLLAAYALGAAVCAWVDFPAERLHLPEYVLMAALVTSAFAPRYPGALWILLVCLSLGCVDEVMQGLIRDRFFDVRDLAVNGVSSLAGVLILRAFGIIGKTAHPEGHIRTCALPFLQMMLLALLLARIRIALASGGDGLSWLEGWQAAMLLAWAAASVVRAEKDAAGPRATTWSAAAAQALIGAGSLLHIPFA